MWFIYSFFTGKPDQPLWQARGGLSIRRFRYTPEPGQTGRWLWRFYFSVSDVSRNGHCTRQSGPAQTAAQSRVLTRPNTFSNERGIQEIPPNLGWPSFLLKSDLLTHAHHNMKRKCLKVADCEVVLKINPAKMERRKKLGKWWMVGAEKLRIKKCWHKVKLNVPNWWASPQWRGQGCCCHENGQWWWTRWQV